jgi:hypothetical protein
LTGKLSQDLTVLHRQLISRRWWKKQRQSFDLFVSQPVYEEIRRGDPQAAQNRSVVLKGVPLLPLTGRIIEAAKLLVDPGPFPKTAGVDAIHIAIATVYGCEYLLTWRL